MANVMFDNPPILSGAEAAQLQKMEGLIERLMQQRDENLSIIERAELIIGRIECRKDRVIIRCYYVEGESEYQIAKDMDMSRQWVNQRRAKTLYLLGNGKKKISE